MSRPVPVVRFTVTDLGSAALAIISVSHSERRALGPHEKRLRTGALYCVLLEKVFVFLRKVPGSDVRVWSPLLSPLAAHFPCDLFHQLRLQFRQNAINDTGNGSGVCFRIARTWSG